MDDETPKKARPERDSEPFEAARWPFEQALWALRRRVLWPLQDWFEGIGTADRAAVGVAAALVLGLFAVIVVSVAASGGAGQQTATQVAAAPAPQPSVEPSPAPKQEAARPTLHGAPPVFKPAKDSIQGVSGSSRPVAPSGQQATGSTTKTTSSAATARISSNPSASASSAGGETGAAAEAEVIPGRPAGPRAISVARRFSQAFVVYETGGEQSRVRRAFARTTTPALAKALLKRPPRLPANVKVPKARVVTVVPGPSREGVYTLSVSLLRVGVTSELRLEMEKLKDEGWRVTNLLG